MSSLKFLTLYIFFVQFSSRLVFPFNFSVHKIFFESLILFLSLLGLFFEPFS